MVKIRPAVIEDLDGIMEVERKTFEPVGEGAMASRNLMLVRVALCNHQEAKWFYVAEYKGKIVGTMVLQPTKVNPEDCTNWDMATDMGTLIKTFDPKGQNIYGASLGVIKQAPSGTVDLLIHKLLIIWLKNRKKYFFICSRMPGYLRAREKSGISPEEYWQLKNSDGKSQDWMLKLFEELIGVKPKRLLLNGFPADNQSAGHGVLCVDDDPLSTLDNIVAKIHQSGFSFGRKVKKASSKRRQRKGGS